MNRGIPEVPIGIEPQLRRYLVDMRQQLINDRMTQAPATVPTNLVVTAQAFGNTVQWTRSVNADFYEVLWSTTPATSGAHVINVGNTAQWHDDVGQSGVTRFYWVRACRNNGYRSAELGFKSATTLAATAGVTPPPPPIQSQVQVLDRRTGRVVFTDPSRLNLP